MKYVILDTSFILTCVKQKIDFREDLEDMGLKTVIPTQVLGELEGMVKSNKNAKLALSIVYSKSFKEVDLKTKNVDAGLVEFGRKNEDVFIATLDREIKKKANNSNVVIRKKKKLEII